MHVGFPRVVIDLPAQGHYRVNVVLDEHNDAMRIDHPPGDARRVQVNEPASQPRKCDLRQPDRAEKLIECSLSCRKQDVDPCWELARSGRFHTEWTDEVRAFEPCRLRSRQLRSGEAERPYQRRSHV